ncbi:uncharacterized protein BDR25DRAFT_371341 [Lindgomyces ingoldianus]|uniref:Uncharacterized protein n=1 Tax=Lindgomyces ingoldianus TaxID=673940 RepID=A0ACB6RDC5_9PLEO|nr:uncharacterized protein BDR25DRAFT_371341 [Lindgomyces ingoldianus]KAF2477283.1 hypothetical protein BDR25DRAFT_371341 [Lindgomyces ingoldianus]
MARSLLSFPPEVLLNILTFLPIQGLLKFSQTCHYSHGLANSSLHTLSLGIYPTRSNPLSKNDPYNVSIIIPDAQTFDFMTLLAFHAALTKSIIIRHGGTLRNLNLSLWTLNTPLAKALASLPALRALSIRIEDFPHVRTVPQARVASQRIEQCKAWDLLAASAVWASRINALRIEGGELSTKQLVALLSQNRWCRELWLCKCNMIGKDLWTFLGSEWEGRTALQILGILRCGGQLDEEVLDVIDILDGLRFLILQGCHGLGNDVVEQRNRDVWRIPECIPPHPQLDRDNVSTIIEVDPTYMNDEY